MFGDKKSLKDSERSLISETVSIDGTVNSSGAIDVAGLVKGPVYSKEIVIKETGSISGGVEAETVEIHGHLITGDSNEIQIGNSGDLKIYHNGSHSFISDTGTGDLYIRSSKTFIQSGEGNNENIIFEGINSPLPIFKKSSSLLFSLKLFKTVLTLSSENLIF